MNIENKRKNAMGDDNRPKRVKKECDYGENCYRRNPAHFREFSHKHLESILNEYSGTGAYPIPDKYVMERLTIMEQLDVIVEKEVYAPWKDILVTTTLQAATNSSAPQNSQQNANLDRNTNPDLGSKNAEMCSKNDKTSSKNAQASSKNAQTSSNSVQTSSKNNQTSSKYAQANSINAQTSSRNAQASSNETSRSYDAVNAGTSGRDVEMSSTSAELNNRNSGHNESETKSVNNNTIQNLNYKKAPDYRPIVLPTRRIEDFLSVVRPKGNMAAKHAAASPYYIFYTTITAARETHTQPNSITFQEILDPSLGELKCSLQINFMVELGWLLAQYYFAGYSEKKLTILYGEDMPELRTISEKKPHIDAHRIAMPTPFGTHHTKMMILCYEDGSLRVVISTANLYLDDWENRTQGLWFSPACIPLPPDAMPHEGDSPTQFKRSLLRYLQHYHLPALVTYIERVKRTDFSHINVFLVASVPGSHSDSEWGMLRAGSLLRQHCALPERWPLVAQASSLGSYGAQPKIWLTGDFLHNFTKTKDPPKVLTAPPDLKLIYPSLENVRQSHDGLLGGGCLPYGAVVHTKQMWLNQFLYQWRAKSTARDRAMPHIKSYTRVSPDNKMAAYYLLTSANVSKAAWGSVNKGNGNLRIMSYEAGVLLLPKFVINKDYFPLVGDTNKLTLPYDLPPIKYENDMSPWVMDYLHT